MFSLIRTLLGLVVLLFVAYCSATVPLGEHTFVGHAARIWSTPETQELVDGVKETGEPVVERIRRGVEAGFEEANEPQPQPPTSADSSKTQHKPPSPTTVPVEIADRLADDQS